MIAPCLPADYLHVLERRHVSPFLFPFTTTTPTLSVAINTQFFFSSRNGNQLLVNDLRRGL